MKIRSKVVVLGIVLGAAAFGLAGCDSAATTASRNLSTEADNFQIQRQVVFYDAITSTYIEEIAGRCSVTVGDSQDTVTCEVGKDKFIKDIMSVSDNTLMFEHQTTPEAVSSYEYQIILRPSTIVPSFSVSTPKALTLVTPGDQQVPQPAPTK